MCFYSGTVVQLEIMDVNLVPSLLVLSRPEKSEALGKRLKKGSCGNNNRFITWASMGTPEFKNRLGFPSATILPLASFQRVRKTVKYVSGF